jgi:hypothetical protein
VAQNGHEVSLLAETVNDDGNSTQFGGAANAEPVEIAYKVPATLH